MDRPGRPSLACAFLLAAVLAGCQSDEPPALPPGGDCTAGAAAALTVPELQQILGRAVAEAEAQDVRATIGIVNRQGDFLTVFAMTGALPIGRFDPELTVQPLLADAPIPTALAALGKAATGAFLSSCGHAFSTRTASFIVQEHFPPTIEFQPGGPLFGVQFSSLPCSDLNQTPLGLAGDPGGLPLYRGGQLVGGVGIEINGVYGIDRDPFAPDEPGRLVEEVIALAATRGFEAPPEIRAEQIVVGGIRFPYVDAAMPDERPVPPFAELPGSVPAPFVLGPGFPYPAGSSSVYIGLGGPSKLVPASVPGIRVDDERVDEQLDCPALVEGQSFAGHFPPRGAPGGLSADEVTRILGQAACRAVTARAAIRRPLGSHAQVNISVVDPQGRLLGLFRTKDAPIFGADVSLQKARTAAFASSPQAAARLRAAGLGRYVDALAAEEVQIDGSSQVTHLRLDGLMAFSDRGNGFLSRPFFPDGIDGTRPGPFSLPIGQFSVLNTGLQMDLIAPGARQILDAFDAGLFPPLGTGCNASLPMLANGLQIFAGSVPLYRGDTLLGGVGVSGDGIDQDDLIALAGSIGFEAPSERRSDKIVVLRDEDGELRRIRLPYVKLPRNPNLGE